VIVGLPNVILLAVQSRARGSEFDRHQWTFYALVASTVWILFAIGKRGSNAGYFMEPLAVFALAIAHSDAPKSVRWARVWGATLLAAPVLSLFVSREYLVQNLGQPARVTWQQLTIIRRLCLEAGRARAIANPQIRSSVTEMEYALTGRVTLAPWQTMMLVRRGKFPLEPLIADLANPSLACLVHPRAFDGPVPPEVDANSELHYFEVLYDVRLREAITSQFEEFDRIGEWHLLRRK
jgi:hypothetical protein